MTFKVGRVYMEPDYGLDCRACDIRDGGFSYASDAAAYVHKHNVEVHGSKCTDPRHRHKKLSKRDRAARVRNAGGTPLEPKRDPSTGGKEGGSER